MSQTLLCKEGYLIPKISKNKSMIELIKKELTVEPFQTCSFLKNQEPIRFQVFQENEEYINVPKHYGIKKFGNPEINKEIK